MYSLHHAAMSRSFPLLVMVLKNSHVKNEEVRPLHYKKKVWRSALHAGPARQGDSTMQQHLPLLKKDIVFRLYLVQKQGAVFTFRKDERCARLLPGLDAF